MATDDCGGQRCRRIGSVRGSDARRANVDDRRAADSRQRKLCSPGRTRCVKHSDFKTLVAVDVPSLSQIQRWKTDHLHLAATHWINAADDWEHSFDSISRRMASAGGMQWSGDAAETAQSRAASTRRTCGGCPTTCARLRPLLAAPPGRSKQRRGGAPRRRRGSRRRFHRR